MKLIVTVLYATLAVIAVADTAHSKIDWARVALIQDVPGFWDGRDIKPAGNPEDVTRNGRIVGGEEVTPNSLPFMAGFVTGYTENVNCGDGCELLVFCGGSIISSTAILTAAHCLIDLGSATVLVGAHNIEVNEPSREFRTSSNKIIHPSYDPIYMNNDIAIFKVTIPFPSNSAIKTIALAPQGTKTYVGYRTLMMGWGSISDLSDEPSPVLRTAEMLVISNSVCKLYYGSTITDKKMCAYHALQGPCTGDDGGPLIINIGVNDAPLVQIGIFSYGTGIVGCHLGLPSVFIRVSSYRTWIDLNM